MNDLDRPPMSIRQNVTTTFSPPGCNRPLRYRIQGRALLRGAIMAVPLLWAGSVLAQTQDMRPQEVPLQGIDDPAEEGAERDPDYGSALSVSAGAAFTTQYWFRGYLQENQGVIAQPYSELGVALFAPEDERYSVDGVVGIWNSVHSEKTGATGAGPGTWYESDVYGGLTFTTGNFELGTIYTFYTYPNGVASTIQEIGLFTGYKWDLAGDDRRDDDLDVWLGIGGAVYFETVDGGGSEDAYAEIGIEPGLDFEMGHNMPVTLSFPVALGFSLDDYYFDAAGDDEVFGYASAAVTVDVALPMPPKYGEWTLSGALNGVFLNAESLKAIDGAQEANLFASLAIDIAF